MHEIHYTDAMLNAIFLGALAYGAWVGVFLIKTYSAVSVVRAQMKIVLKYILGSEDAGDSLPLHAKRRQGRH